MPSLGKHEHRYSIVKTGSRRLNSGQRTHFVVAQCMGCAYRSRIDEERGMEQIMNCARRVFNLK